MSPEESRDLGSQLALPNEDELEIPGVSPEIVALIRREVRLGVHEVVVSYEAHSGPLPLPRQLKEYDQALTGLAERIANSAFAEQTHRHKIEELRTRAEVGAIEGDLRLASRGQVFAMFVVGGTVIVAVIFALLRIPVVAVSSLAVTIVTVFGARLFAPRQPSNSPNSRSQSEKDE